MTIADVSVVADARDQDYILRYGHTEPSHGQTSDLESEAERQRRIAWEAERIAEADAELEAGLYVDADEVRAWIDSLRTDTPLPPPPTRHR